MLLSLAYAILKGIDLVTRHGPTINDYQIPSYFEISKTVNLNEIDFKFAFSIRNYHTHDLKNDPSYVKWIVRQSIK